MTSDSRAPREIIGHFIGDKFIGIGPIFNNTDGIVTVDTVPMIERSAYEQLEKQKDHYRQQCMKYEGTIDQLTKELTEAKYQLQFTNSNWPHEKKLCEELAELKTHCELLRDGAKMQTLDEAQKELAEAKAEIERLKGKYES